MQRHRTFIAVDPGEAIRQRLIALQQKLGHTSPGVKWVEEENLHLTLLFLGEVERRETLAICRLVQDHTRSLPSFTLEVSGLGAFPNTRRPKIVWAGVTDGLDAMKELHKRIEEPLFERGGYRREDRGYTPHLTLGRIAAEDRDEGWSATLAAHADWSAGATTINEVLVMSSELRRAGPVYTVLGRAHLSAGKSDVE